MLHLPSSKQTNEAIFEAFQVNDKCPFKKQRACMSLYVLQEKKQQNMLSISNFILYLCKFVCQAKSVPEAVLLQFSFFSFFLSIFLWPYYTKTSSLSFPQGFVNKSLQFGSRQVLYYSTLYIFSLFLVTLRS